MKIITAAQIQSLPARGFDELLKKSLSVDVIQYQGFNSVIGMRGFAPSGFGKANTLIVVDGIPLGTSNLSTINLENVEQLEILKGPYSAFFGSDAMAGVINISTRQSTGKLSGKISIGYGTYQKHKLDLNLGGKINKWANFDFYAGSSAQNENYKTGNNNLLKLSGAEKAVMEEKSFGKEYQNSKYRQYQAGGRLGLTLNENWKIRLDQSYWLAKDIQNNGNFWASYPGQLQDIDRWTQGLSVEGKMNRHQLRLSPHYSSEKNVYYSDLTDDAFKQQESVLKTYGFVLQDAISLGNHLLIAGVDHLSRKNSSQIWLSTDMQGSPYQPDYLNSSIGAYLQFNMHFLNDRFTISTGGRYDFISSKLFETGLIESIDAKETYHVFNPSIGLNFKFAEGFSVHGAAGTAFVAPDAFKLAGYYETMFGTYKGNPGLNPETSMTWDMGLAYSNRKNGLSFDLTYFSTHYKNIVGYDFSSMEYTSFKNEDKADMDGLEIDFAWDLGAISNYRYSLKAYASYTSLFNSKVDVSGQKMEMKYVRKNKATFGVDYTTKKGISARLNFRYVGQRFEDNWLYNLDFLTWERIPVLDQNGNEIRPSLINQDIIEFPDHLLADLSVSWVLKSRYGISFSIDNLFDENYAEKDMYYMPGRNIMFSLFLKI